MLGKGLANNIDHQDRGIGRAKMKICGKFAIECPAHRAGEVEMNSSGVLGAMFVRAEMYGQSIVTWEANLRESQDMAGPSRAAS